MTGSSLVGNCFAHVVRDSSKNLTGVSKSALAVTHFKRLEDWSPTLLRSGQDFAALYSVLFLQIRLRIITTCKRVQADSTCL